MKRRGFLKAAAALLGATPAAPAIAPAIAPALLNPVTGGSLAAAAGTGVGAAGALEPAPLLIPGTAAWLWRKLRDDQLVRDEWREVWREYRKGLRRRRWNAKPCRVIWLEHRLRKERRGLLNSAGTRIKMRNPWRRAQAKVRAVFPDWRW